MKAHGMTRIDTPDAPQPGRSLEGMTCFLELLAFITHEDSATRPGGVSRTIATFTRAWSDGLSDEDYLRSILFLLPDMIGTGPLTDGQEAELQGAIIDWRLLVWTPAWLDLVPEVWKAAGDIRADRAIGLRDIEAWTRADERSRMLFARAAERSAGEAALRTTSRRGYDRAHTIAGAAAGIATLRHGVNVLEPVIDLLQTSAVELIHGLCDRAKDLRG